MQMQQSMQALQGSGFPMGGMGGMGMGGMGIPQQPAPGGLDFSALLGAPSPYASYPYPQYAAPASVPVAPQEAPAVRFASQLTQMADMGFTDVPANITALTASNGCVTGAVERLLGNR